MGQGRGEDAASPRLIDAAEKRAKALELRKAGATYDQIARQVGYADRGGAYRAVATALKQITEEPAHEVRQLELERLDAMLLGLWPNARKGKEGAIDRALRIMERRAKLLGLDTPLKADVGGLVSLTDLLAAAATTDPDEGADTGTDAGD